MNEPVSPRERYASRALELDPRRSGDRRAAHVLGAAGDLLRRSAALSIDRDAIDAALLGLPGHEIEAWVASSPERPLAAVFERVTESAALVALAESDEERALARHTTLEALRARDTLESSLVALSRSAALGVTLNASTPHRFTDRLDALDRALRTKTRWLVGVNALRREERDLLDPAHRERAYWYSSRATCDGLLLALAGEGHASPTWGAHLHGCAACAADLTQSRVIEAPPTAHLSPDDLFRYELGELGARERSRVERHADACFDCGQALWALADGERAIDESSTGDLSAL
jgi:hypothetical protein